MAKSRKPRKKIIKEKHVDALFSLYIRERDNWTCRFCHIRIEPPTNKIQCSHYVPRGIRSTRFDTSNCISLDSRCHYIHEKQKQYFYRDWMIQWLGEAEYKALEERSKEIKQYRQSDYEELVEKLTIGIEALKVKNRGFVIGAR